MCKFFSLVSDGQGKPYYFDDELRKKWLKKEIKQESPDSHTSIADHFGFKAEKEDKLNKYEYNPLTKIFTIDQLNTTDDSAVIKKFCEELDFKTVVKELNIHPIVNPFEDFKITKATAGDIKLLKEWASVRASVLASAWASVGDSVWDSVWDIVGASVWDSVRDSVGAYYATFFDIKYKHDFSSAQKLWNKGLVPSFDGKVWRLHGHKGKVVWEGKLTP